MVINRDNKESNPENKKAPRRSKNEIIQSRQRKKRQAIANSIIEEELAQKIIEKERADREKAAQDLAVIKRRKIVEEYEKSQKEEVKKIAEVQNLPSQHPVDEDSIPPTIQPVENEVAQKIDTTPRSPSPEEVIEAIKREKDFEVFMRQEERDGFILECLELRKKGYSYPKIKDLMADKAPSSVGLLNEHKIARLLTNYLERVEMADKNPEAMRALAHLRLDKLYEIAYEQAEEKKDCRAIAVAANIVKQKCELYGLNVKQMDELTAIEVLVKSGVIDTSMLKTIASKTKEFKQNVVSIFRNLPSNENTPTTAE